MMAEANPNEVIINEVAYVRKDVAHATDCEGREYVIVRCRDAGVHAGYLDERDDESGTCVLLRSRRLWRWHGRTLSGLALDGTDDANKCKFGDELPRIILRGWCEIIPCTDAARESLQAVARWEND